jgi:hypothetical protein
VQRDYQWIATLTGDNMPYFYRDEPTTKQVVTGFECSKCGAKHNSDDFIEMQEAIHWRDTGGYGSVWGDGVTYEITLCQTCAHELFKDIATIHQPD